MIERGVINKITEQTIAQNQSVDLLQHLQKTLKYTCSKQYGFILEVHRIVNIHSRKISIYNGNIIVYCSIEVDYLLPQPGKRMKGIIHQIFPQGVIAIVSDCMKVFIPSEQRRQHESIEFEIVQIRFQKGKYDCIGKLV